VMMMPEYRQKAIEEYGEECQVCGRTSNVEVHHRDGDRTNNRLENLIPMCRGCHTRVHRGRLEKFSEELLPTDERGHLSEDTTTIALSLDDDVAAEAKAVKESRGLTWAEFIETAAEEMDDAE